MAFLAATTVSATLSPCAEMCINNMNSKAPELGCMSGDIDCLCKSVNYMYGIRDCTLQACPSVNVSSVISVALSNCSTAALAPNPNYHTVAKTHSPAPAIVSSFLGIPSPRAGGTAMLGGTTASIQSVPTTPKFTGPGPTSSKSKTPTGSLTVLAAPTRTAVSSATSEAGAAHPMATIAGGAVGALGLAALLAL